MILYVGREYQEKIQEEKKLRETNEGNVRIDTDHIEVNRKMKSLNLFLVVFFMKTMIKNKEAMYWYELFNLS